MRSSDLYCLSVTDRSRDVRTDWRRWRLFRWRAMEGDEELVH